MIYILIFFSLSSCALIFGDFFDEKLFMNKQDYSGHELRTDGYYAYNYTVKPSYSKDSVTYATILFLYSNGILIKRTYDVENITEIKKRIEGGSFNQHLIKCKYCYGLFQVNENRIKIEKWAPSSGGALKSYLKDGKILNDTTFILYNNSTEGEIDTVGTIYHFKQFNPKPDSTNNFIK